MQEKNVRTKRFFETALGRRTTEAKFMPLLIRDYLRREKREIANFFRPNTDFSVLDVGCGSGRYINLLEPIL